MNFRFRLDFIYLCYEAFCDVCISSCALTSLKCDIFVPYLALQMVCCLWSQTDLEEKRTAGEAVA